MLGVIVLMKLAPLHSARPAVCSAALSAASHAAWSLRMTKGVAWPPHSHAMSHGEYCDLQGRLPNMTTVSPSLSVIRE